MKYIIVSTNKFNKQLEKMKKRNKNFEKLKFVVNELANGEILDRKFLDHKLEDTENYKNYRECHIEPDWVLVYKKDKDRLILTLIETGSHNDLF